MPTSEAKDSLSLSTVKLLLQQQRDDFNSLIATFMKSFNERFDELRTEMNEIKHSLEYSQKDIEGLAALKSTHEDLTSSLKTDVSALSENLDNLVAKVDYLENQSRRNNLRFDGIPDNPQESWDDSEKKVLDVLNTKFGFETPPVIERAHRVGPAKPQRVRSIVVKFNHFKDREQVYRNRSVLKGSKIYVNEDLSEKVMKKRNEQLHLLKEARSEGKLAYFSMDKLVVKERGLADPKLKPVGRPVTRSSTTAS